MFARSQGTEADDVLYLSKFPAGVRKRRRARRVPVDDWDELVLDQLSKDTARWIVLESLSSGKQREKLSKFVKKKFGQKISNTYLIREEVTGSFFLIKRKIKYGKGFSRQNKNVADNN